MYIFKFHIHFINKYIYYIDNRYQLYMLNLISIKINLDVNDPMRFM